MRIETTRENIKNGKIRVGMKGAFYSSSIGGICYVSGVIGEIKRFSDSVSVFVWQNKLNGCVGKISPHTKGYKYSFWIGLNCFMEVAGMQKEVVKNTKEEMVIRYEV